MRDVIWINDQIIYQCLASYGFIHKHVEKEWNTISHSVVACNIKQALIKHNRIHAKFQEIDFFDNRNFQLKVLIYLHETWNVPRQ